MAFVALTSPFLGGIADFSGKRKRLLFVYTILCVLSVASFSFLQKGMIFEGFILILLANIGLEGGLVFYNSFLPEITVREYQGRVSAWGYAIGYAGSILSLLIALPLIKRGLYNETWIMVSIFFAAFSLPAFLFLPSDKSTDLTLVSSAKHGSRYLWNTFKDIWKQKELRRFLIGFLIYEDGVNTIIIFSSIFAATTIGFNPKELIGLYMIVQVTALSGAFAMARPIDLWGPKKVVIVSLLLWSSVSLLSFFIYVKVYFWIVAIVAGLGLGTVQAASRAFFAQFIPSGHESAYFGVYSLVGKSSAVAGPLVFGGLSYAFGSQRPAILAVSAFFIIGLVIIRGVKGGGPNIERG
ncbi:MAG: hypothetical protein A2X59_09445 [Nitrospirae bacterium GWC2_42_7]|nr:MAG: hypothetical protein A2X59_09445 [Nitrospirae bacterium GWC2_42_7]